MSLSHGGRFSFEQLTDCGIFIRQFELLEYGKEDTDTEISNSKMNGVGVKECLKLTFFRFRVIDGIVQQLGECIADNVQRMFSKVVSEVKESRHLPKNLVLLNAL